MALEAEARRRVGGGVTWTRWAADVPRLASRLLFLVQLGIALVLLGASSGVSQAQVIPDSVARARADSIARADSVARADSIARVGLARRDSTAPPDTLRIPGRAPIDTLPTQRIITWDPSDSVMNALLSRRGYSVTRYQGNSVQFISDRNEMLLRGKAQVARDSATLVGDTILFNDSTQIVEARGDTVLLRDPARGPDDVIGQRVLRYDVTAREGLAYGVSTAVESGERWIVHGNVAAFKGDTLPNGQNAFYAQGGRFTACTDPNPHFHFAAGEIKMISQNILVARPAVMYIADIPVFWLPFIFQDVRSGRRSGIIPPRIGFSDIIRNRSNYRRNIEDFGFYFALSDYVDAELTMDWRSDASPGEGDPGWVKFNGRTRYAWRDRFINGELGISQHFLRDGATNQQYSLNHQQKFSERTSVTATLNYVTNTRVQRNTTLDPYAAVQSIRSQLNFSTGRGPFSLTLGGSQSQYPGRDNIERTFPSLNIRSKPIEVGEWLTWTPTFSLTNDETLHIDQVGEFAYRFVPKPGGGVDSVALDRNRRNTSIRFDTPLEIRGFNWRNSFSLTERFNDFPERRNVYLDLRDTSSKVVRIFKQTYLTEVNWETGFSLPSFFQDSWKVSPSVSIQKVDPAGLMVRSERTGNRFVTQSLRPAFSIGVGPTLHRIFPGIGPVAAIRHTISPTLSIQYVPKGNVSDEFLRAIGGRRVGYLGANQQRTVSLGLQTVFEAKLRPAIDTIPQDRWQKIKILSLGFTPLSWDFERAKVTGGTGLANTSFGVTARSDLLPGFDIGVDWSLFQGDPISDTAVFKPYRQSIRGSLSLGPASPIVQGIARLLGIEFSSGSSSGAPGTSAPPPNPLGASPGFIAGQPITGSINRIANQMSVPAGQGWNWSLSYSAQRTRPPSGSGVIIVDPLADCRPYVGTLIYDTCVQQASPTSGSDGPGEGTTYGGTYYVTPPQSSAQSNLSFHITEKWGAQWATTYDFTLKEFASQIFTLTREMHDWNANFSFLRAPNGNFTFNFHISLKAQPELKFDWDTRDYDRRLTGVPR